VGKAFRNNEYTFLQDKIQVSIESVSNPEPLCSSDCACLLDTNCLYCCESLALERNVDIGTVRVTLGDGFESLKIETDTIFPRIIVKSGIPFLNRNDVEQIMGVFGTVEKIEYIHDDIYVTFSTVGATKLAIDSLNGTNVYGQVFMIENDTGVILQPVTVKSIRY
jgi:hypothetical protein